VVRILWAEARIGEVLSKEEKGLRVGIAFASFPTMMNLQDPTGVLSGFIWSGKACSCRWGIGIRRRSACGLAAGAGLSRLCRRPIA